MKRMTPTNRRPVRATLIAAAAIVATTMASPAVADSITLRNGSTVTGTVRQLDGGYEVTRADGKRQFVPTADVRSIKLDSEGKVDEADARERLASLKRSVESERDLARVVARYEQFVAMNANTEAARLAGAELDRWRTWRDERRVKVGARWLTPVERDAALVETARAVASIRGLMAEERFDDAAAEVREAARLDPENVSLLYLGGLLQLRREQWPEAKRSFDAVATQIGDHPPTLVNLAVLAAQFKRWPQAIALLDQAMALAPGAAEVLDAVVELDQLVPESQRRSTAFERMMKRFAAQEQQLAARQAQRGLYRWGSRWVDAATLEQVTRDREAFEAKKSDMEADYAATQEQIRKADENIDYFQGLIARIEGDALVRDVNGNVLRRPLPPAYWDAQRDLERAQRERRAATDHVAELKRQAELVKQSEPNPPYAGKLTPIGERGVPVLLPANAATRPTSMPATTEPTPTDVTTTTRPTSRPAAGGLFEE